jgi:hypothetical protein
VYNRRDRHVGITGIDRRLIMNTEQKLMSLINSTRVLTSTLDLEEVLDQLIKEVLNVIDGSNASVLFLYDKRTDKLYPKSAAGFDMRYLKNIRVSPGEGMSGQTFAEGKGKIFLSITDTKEGMSNISEDTLELYSKALGDLQYPVSAICVPIMTKRECIGVLTVDIYDKKNVNFDEGELRLLETFAVQASVAIENAMLFSQNERTQEIHEKLTAVSLSKGGIKEITEALSKLVHQKVAVFNEFFDVLATSCRETDQYVERLLDYEKDILPEVMASEEPFTHTFQHLDVTEVVLFSIKTDHFKIGYVAIFSEEKSILDPLDQFAIEQAMTIFALEMNRIEKVTINNLNYSGYILEKLLHYQNNPISTRELSKLNFSEHENHRFIVAQMFIQEPLISFKELAERKGKLSRLIHREITRFPYKTLVLDRNMEMVFMFVISPYGDKDQLVLKIKNLFSGIQERAKDDLQFFSFVGFGRVVEALHDVHISFRDTKRCVEYLLSKQKEGMISYSELGIQRLFMKTDREELQEFVHDLLGPILEYDRTRDSNLHLTLKTYLESDQNMSISAKKLFVHTNTIKYRLKTIRDILNMEILGGPSIFVLQLALHIQDYLNDE